MEDLRSLVQVGVQVPALLILGWVFYLIFKTILGQLVEKIDKLIEVVSSFTSALVELTIALRAHSDDHRGSRGK